MAATFSASSAPKSTSGLFKNAGSFSPATPNPARGSLEGGMPAYSGDRLGFNSSPGQAAYGPIKQGTRGQSYRALEGGGYVNQSGEKVSGFSTPGKSSGGGGGGGGGGAPQMAAAAPMDFFRGLAPEMKKLDIPLEDYTKMLGKVNNPEELAALADRYNAPTQKSFDSDLPFFNASMSALGGQALDALSGRVSKTTAQSIARSAAQANLGSGLGGVMMGAMGGIARSATLRDFGRASMDAVSHGADLFSRSVGMAQQKRAMASPVSTANLMVAPGAIYDTLITQAQNNQNITNANLMNAWQSQALPGQFDITTGKYVGYQPGQRTTYRPNTPEQQREQDFQDRLASLSKGQPGRYSRGPAVGDGGYQIADKYNPGRFV